MNRVFIVGSSLRAPLDPALSTLKPDDLFQVVLARFYLYLVLGQMMRSSAARLEIGRFSFDLLKSQRAEVIRPGSLKPPTTANGVKADVSDKTSKSYPEIAPDTRFLTAFESLENQRNARPRWGMVEMLVGGASGLKPNPGNERRPIDPAFRHADSCGKD